MWGVTTRLVCYFWIKVLLSLEDNSKALVIESESGVCYSCYGFASCKERKQHLHPGIQEAAIADQTSGVAPSAIAGDATIAAIVGDTKRTSHIKVFAATSSVLSHEVCEEGL